MPRPSGSFAWAQLDRFNWALDYFDFLPADHLGLWRVNGDGSEERRTFGEPSQRSNQVANYLRGLGVRRGDRILLLLGNCVPL